MTLSCIPVSWLLTGGSLEAGGRGVELGALHYTTEPGKGHFLPTPTLARMHAHARAHTHSKAQEQRLFTKTLVNLCISLLARLLASLFCRVFDFLVNPPHTKRAPN